MKRKKEIKTKLSQLEKQFSELAKDVTELRQTIAKDIEVVEEEIQQETIKDDEIDWDVPQLVITNSGKVVATNGIHKGNNFSGNVVVYDNVTQPVNYFCNNWCKEYFKPFKGEITIKN